MENITQSEDTLELEVLIHDDQTVDSGLANGIKDGVQSIVERAGVDPRETLGNNQHIYQIRHSRRATYRRTFLQRFANRKAQVIVNTTLDESNDIDRLEHIIDNACARD